MKQKIILLCALIAITACNTDPEIGRGSYFGGVSATTVNDAEAIINFTISDGDYSSNITSLLVCYSSDNKVPTSADEYVSVPHPSQNYDWYFEGSYDVELTNLRPGTTYYARVYAAYGPRGMYSDVVTFTTTGQNPNPSHDPTTDPSEPPSMFITEVNSVGFRNKSKYDELTNPEWLQISGTVLYIVNGTRGDLLLIDDNGIVPVYGVTAAIQKDRVNDQSFSSLDITRGSHITICGTKHTYKDVDELYCAYLVSKDTYTSDYIVPPSTIENSLTLVSQNFAGGTKTYELLKNESGCWFGVKSDSWSMWVYFYYNKESSTSVIPYGTYNIDDTYKYGTVGAGEGYGRDDSFYGSYLFTNTGNVTTCNLLFLKSGTVTVSAGTGYGQKISINAVTSAEQPLAVNYEIDNITLKNCVVASISFYAPRKKTVK